MTAETEETQILKHYQYIYIRQLDLIQNHIYSQFFPPWVYRQECQNNVLTFFNKLNLLK